MTSNLINTALAQTTTVDMNEGIQDRLERAINHYEKLRGEFAVAASGRPMKRTDNTTYTMDPEDAIARYTEDLSKAQGAYRLAQSIFQLVEKQDVSLYEATRKTIDYYVDRGFIGGTRYSDGVREAQRHASEEGSLDLLKDLMFDVQWAEKKRDERVSLEAAKFAELIGADPVNAEDTWQANLPGLESGSAAENVVRQLRSNSLMILTDPRLRGALDDKALEQMQHPFGISPQGVRHAVQADIDRENAEKKAESEKQAAARKQRQLVQCNGSVSQGSRSFSWSRCDKNGRYLVTLSARVGGLYDGYRGDKPVDISKPVRICGTHLKSTCKDYRGGWKSEVVKVVDTKTDEVVYEKEAVASK